jgi:hypothetical protein
MRTPRRYQCIRCLRVTPIYAYDGLCRWCFERDASGRPSAPHSAPAAPDFEPPSAATRFVCELVVCSAIGVAFVGAITTVTATGLHGLDLRGLLPLASLPHVAALVCVFHRTVRAARIRVVGRHRLLDVGDVAVALVCGLLVTGACWSHGATWVHAAARDRSVSFNVLMLAGLDVDARDERGYTALIYAAEAGDTQTIELLLSYGADVNRDDTSGTALTKAAAKGHLRTVRLLIDRGARLDAVNRHGLSALALARRHGRADVEAFLAQRVPRQASPSGGDGHGTASGSDRVDRAR